MKYFSGYKLARCIRSLRDETIKEGEFIQFSADRYFDYAVLILRIVEGPDYKKGIIKEEFGLSIPETWFHKHFQILE